MVAVQLCEQRGIQYGKNSISRISCILYSPNVTVCTALKGMLTQSLIAGFICCTVSPAAILCFSQLFFTFVNSSASIRVIQRLM
jgi:hypothetical protein